MPKRYNCLGQDIGNKPYELASPAYETGVVRSYGPEINWEKLREENPYADENGFDTRYEQKEIVLPAGTRIIRYGSPYGRYTAPYGTLFEQLSLPYKKETVEYHEYVVMSPVSVKCRVIAGIIASGFDQPGKGVQYIHKTAIANLLKDGILKEDLKWTKKAH